MSDFCRNVASQQHCLRQIILLKRKGKSFLNPGGITSILCTALSRSLRATRRPLGVSSQNLGRPSGRPFFVNGHPLPTLPHQLASLAARRGRARKNGLPLNPLPLQTEGLRFDGGGLGGGGRARSYDGDSTPSPGPRARCMSTVSTQRTRIPDDRQHLRPPPPRPAPISLRACRPAGGGGRGSAHL